MLLEFTGALPKLKTWLYYEFVGCQWCSGVAGNELFKRCNPGIVLFHIIGNRSSSYPCFLD